MDYILEKLFEGYGNNPYRVKTEFYEDLSNELNNHSNKIDFLDKLIIEINNKKCDCTYDDCYIKGIKPIACEIIKSKKEEIDMEKQNKINIDNSINKNVITDSENIHINNHNGDKNGEKGTGIKTLYYIIAIVSSIIGLYKFFL